LGVEVNLSSWLLTITAECIDLASQIG